MAVVGSHHVLGGKVEFDENTGGTRQSHSLKKGRGYELVILFIGINYRFIIVDFTSSLINYHEAKI